MITDSIWQWHLAVSNNQLLIVSYILWLPPKVSIGHHSPQSIHIYSIDICTILEKDLDEGETAGLSSQVHWRGGVLLTSFSWISSVFQAELQCRYTS